jgi:galactoside O-acetyltransferase
VLQRLSNYNNGSSFYTREKNWNVVKASPIIIHDKVWIGFGCTILHGVTIGEGAIVGAQSVVRRNVEPWTIAAGNPAVFIKKISHE